MNMHADFKVECSVCGHRESNWWLSIGEYYECGMLPVGEGSTRLSVKFYLVAMLFILFDVEVVFLYPWAVVYKDMLADAATRNMILFGMVSFIGVLFIGYIYALKKGAFNWRR